MYKYVFFIRHPERNSDEVQNVAERSPIKVWDLSIQLAPIVAHFTQDDNRKIPQNKQITPFIINRPKPYSLPHQPLCFFLV